MAYTGQPHSTIRRTSPVMDNPDGDLKSLLIRVAEQADKAAFARLFQHFAPR
ncbi:MAG: sigma-70 family RNA polymerase sigma factor, partial [Aeromonas veronii]